MRAIDNSAVRQSQVARLQRVRAARDAGAVAAALQALKEAAALRTEDGSARVNLLDLAVKVKRCHKTQINIPIRYQCCLSMAHHPRQAAQKC